MLFDEIFLVQLFSNPQQTVAARTKREPYENLKLSVPSSESRMLDSVISAIAAHSLPEIGSLKIKSAISEVATISKLPSREAFADVPLLMPSIRKTGAAMSRTIIPTANGRSFFVSFSDLVLSFLFTRDRMPMPIPAPR